MDPPWPATIVSLPRGECQIRPADRTDLLAWLERLEEAPRGLFLTHGEERAAEALAGQVRERFGWRVEVPDYLDEVELV